MGRNIVKTSIWVTLILCIGYAVSFLKESVIANYFGVSADVDAYTIAIQIPVILFSFVAVALRSIVVPIYTDIKHNHGQKESEEYINVLIGVLGVFALLFVALVFIFAKYVIMIFAPGFSAETNATAAELLRILSPTILTTLLANVFLSVLNVHGKFVLPSIAVLFLNTTIIITILFMHSHWGIASAATGQLLGCILEVCFLAILLHNTLRFRPKFDWQNTFMRKSVKMALPVIWSTSIAELNAMINRIVASFLFVGSIATLSYAAKINSVFISLFTSAIATIIYPLYAESTAKNDMEELNMRINKTLSAYSLFLIPLTCIILCLKKEIIGIAFERGAFNADAVDRTQILLGWYSVGLIFMGFRESLTKVFYSLKDTKTPAVNATIGFIINILLNLTLPLMWGVSGLAISTSITALIISSGLLIRLLKKHNEIHISILIQNVLKILPCSLISTIICLVVVKITPTNDKYILSVVRLVAFVISYLITLITIKPSIWGELVKGFFGKKTRHDTNSN